MSPGCWGLSETSADVRDLLRRKSRDARAREALDLFCYQAKKWIGSFAAVLGGLDTLVFAGGVGENSPAIRQQICEGLEFLGVKLSPTANQSAGKVACRRGHIVRPIGRVRSRHSHG